MGRATAGRGAVYEESGTTLTELLVVLSLFTIVIAAGWVLLGAASAMSDQIDAQARVAEETRLAMDRITTELRQASELPGMDGAGVFSEISTSACGFYADVDHDGRLERVLYGRDGSRLMRSVAEPVVVDGFYTFGPQGPAQAVVFGIPSDHSAPIFKFWSRANPPVELATADMASVSSVSVRIRNSVTVGQKTGYTDLETWIKVRSVQNSVN